MRSLGPVVLLVALLFLGPVLLGPSYVQAQQVEPQVVLYDPPVLTEVIDPFRPPSSFAGPGNRGLEYGQADGRVVVAAAAGLVTFAGGVAGRNVITIEHGDGVRTTYTGLREIWVEVDDFPSRGATIALAESGFHFGARWGEHYLDPQILLDASQPQSRIRLIAPPSS